MAERDTASLMETNSLKDHILRLSGSGGVIMTRLALAIIAVALLIFLPGGTQAGGRFDTKLSKDQQILQAINRLTFGARPGDIEEVRRLGVDKWVDLQLHPERIPENPVLDERLKPLATLRLDLAEIIASYPQNN